MTSRERILRAAVRVFSEEGFLGATTRRIAEEAGVNEVTLFRHFGSKSALLEEAVRAQLDVAHVPRLPGEPADPERELGEWCRELMVRLRASRTLIRQCFAEAEANPQFLACATEGLAASGTELRRYVRRLVARGLVDRDADIEAATAMLFSAALSDSLAGAEVPQIFPRSRSAAPVRYARAFLRAIGAG